MTSDKPRSYGRKHWKFSSLLQKEGVERNQPNIRGYLYQLADADQLMLHCNALQKKSLELRERSHFIRTQKFSIASL